jgi:erythromycin esterase-like protein
MKLLGTAVALLALAGTGPVEEWIRGNAIRLETVEAGHGFADMQPLKKVVGDARIVALGEATHGTREFFQLKHRMLEFLATEMGFTIFSIEANMPEAYRLNEYVLTGKGDPRQLLKGMYFWTWNTEEVLDMILWMREFNKSGKGHLEFTGFDMQTPTVAAEIVRDFVAREDPEYVAKVKEAPLETGPGQNFGVATARFPVQDAAGKRVRFSGYIKTEGITRGWAGLWWRVDGAKGTLAFDNMQNRGATGTTDWKRYEVELPVAAEATNINFGAILGGDGRAWFDGLAIEVDGKPYAHPLPTWLFTGGKGYLVGPDSSVFRSGNESLGMRFAGDAGGADPKAAAVSWREVVRHMEASRGAYEAKGATPREAAWAIQNARVVLQSMEMRSGEVSRDASMAANVQWILEQSRGAKIVLWAHNGHVAASGPGGYAPMGGSLRKVYGDQMAVFGFAFDQGSFQSVDKSKGLRDFTVPPAPGGSLDSTLAAAGIPLFALDLRLAPKAGPVAQWLAEPHKTRSIGAVYSEGAGDSYLYDLVAPQCFDVLLFVEKTTAARKNPGAWGG